MCINALVDILFSDVDTMQGSQVLLCLETLVNVIKDESGSTCSPRSVLFILDYLWRLHPSNDKMGTMSILTFSGEDVPYYLKESGLVARKDFNVSVPSANKKRNMEIHYRAIAHSDVGTGADSDSLSSSSSSSTHSSKVTIDSSAMLYAVIDVYIRTSNSLTRGVELLSDVSGLMRPRRVARMRPVDENLDTFALLSIAFIVVHSLYEPDCDLSPLASALVDSTNALALDHWGKPRMVEVSMDLNDENGSFSSATSAPPSSASSPTASPDPVRTSLYAKSTVLPGRMQHMLRWAERLGLACATSAVKQKNTHGANWFRPPQSPKTMLFCVNELGLTLRLLDILWKLKPQVTFSARSRMAALFTRWSMPKSAESRPISWMAWPHIVGTAVTNMVSDLPMNFHAGAILLKEEINARRVRNILPDTHSLDEEVNAGVMDADTHAIRYRYNLMDRCIDEVTTFLVDIEEGEQCDMHDAHPTPEIGLLVSQCAAMVWCQSLNERQNPTGVEKCGKVVVKLLEQVNSLNKCKEEDVSFAETLLLEATRRISPLLTSRTKDNIMAAAKPFDPAFQSVLLSLLESKSSSVRSGAGLSKYKRTLMVQWSALEFSHTQWWTLEDRLIEVRVGSGIHKGRMMVCQRSCLDEQYWQLDIPCVGESELPDGMAAFEESVRTTGFSGETSEEGSMVSTPATSPTEAMSHLDMDVEELVRSLFWAGNSSELVRLNPHRTRARSDVRGSSPARCATNLEDRITRAVTMLNTTPKRSAHKVALLYRPAGAKSEDDVLAGNHSSPTFDRFIRALGSIEPIAGLEFCGGLDKSALAKDGVDALVNETDESITLFHVPTLMPQAVDEDVKEVVLRRKRHVGNDAVHVIYIDENQCENAGSPFKWHMDSEDTSSVSLLSGSYGMVELVITPSRSVVVSADEPRLPELYRVDVRVKKNMPLLQWLRTTQLLSFDKVVSFVQHMSCLASFSCDSFMRDQLDAMSTSTMLNRQIIINQCRNNYGTPSQVPSSASVPFVKREKVTIENAAAAVTAASLEVLPLPYSTASLGNLLPLRQRTGSASTPKWLEEPTKPLVSNTPYQKFELSKYWPGFAM
jgi:hypothetical protein